MDSVYWYNRFLECKLYQLHEAAIPLIICLNGAWCPGAPYLLCILSFGLEDLSQKTDVSTRMMIFMMTTRMTMMMMMVMVANDGVAGEFEEEPDWPFGV